PHLTKKASDSKEKQAKPSKGALSRYSYGFVTCGNKSIKFWSLDASGSLKSKKGVFGTKGPIQTISAVSFNDNGATVSGTVSGDIYIWKDNLLADVIAAHPKFVIYGIKKIVGDDTYAFISGAKDGSICLWDSDFTLLKRYEGQDLFLQQTEGGDSAVGSDAEQEKQKTTKETNPVAIKCVDWHNRHVLFGTGHNSIHQIDDLEAGRPSVIVKAHYGDLYGLATYENYFATCGDDGRLCLWSCSPANQLEKEVYLGRSAHAAAFSAKGEYLAVGTETGHIMVFKSPELHQCWSTQVHVHNSTPAIRQLRFSPDDRYLAITQENVIHLYALEEEGSCSYRSVGTLKGHTSAIIHCDFSEDSKYLQTDSNSYELLYWDLENMQMVMHPGAIRDVNYHTWSCVLGWAVVGIWPPGSDGTDVNAVSRSSDRKLLVTGDDFNGVKLFSYPVTKPQAAHKRYAGHSSHVMNVSFAAGDNKVVSVGGKDHSVFQWALI
ncbi:Echinoderm microtubule-associated protein-like 1, partial [Balamuthia mandrillaris]